MTWIKKLKIRMVEFRVPKQMLPSELVFVTNL